ncbi:MAG TPA: hypothetical protein VKD89_06405 [Candidatus Udaeobacter sp.]|nr:hypothetical protein [Candidatus Udaeobacter sp.]
MTPIDVLREATERGLSLSVNGQKLRVSPWELLTPDFAETLKAHKWHLLSVLRWPFLMVQSESLGETIFLCEDKAAKEALVGVGASAWSIYTRHELRILMEQNRIAPLTLSELNLLHAFKRIFNARIAE